MALEHYFAAKVVQDRDPAIGESFHPFLGVILVAVREVGHSADRSIREAMFRELCEKIGIPAEKYLPPQ